VGGSARSCDDGNPCTEDTCSPTLGCQHVNNDARVPDDGVACTVDTCASGVAAHAPSNAACDDGKWCTGVEVCEPAHPSADARGCRHTNVPQPPGLLGPCRQAGACDEATRSFPIRDRPSTTTCDDGLACTTGDHCDGSGACRGNALPGCAGSATCSSTTPLASTFDLPWGAVEGTMTMSGGPLPATHSDYTGGSFYLVAKDTGVRHLIATFRYTWQSGSTYVLASSSYSARVVTGLYDLVYARACAPPQTCDARVDGSLGAQVNGYRVLRSDVVIGPGRNLLTLDVPTTNLSGTMTMNGGPLPPTHSDYTGGTFYLVAKDTGAVHTIATFRYTWQSGSTYTLASSSYSARVLPGTYDLVYGRNCSGAADSSCDERVDSSLGAQVNGYRVLATNVVVSGASQTLNIDLPATNLTGTMTMNGGPLPPVHSDYTGGSFYLIAKDTGVSHLIGTFRYTWQSGSTYSLASSTYSARVLPGAYRLVYGRGCSATSSCDSRVDASLGAQVNGYRVLAENVVVSGASQTLDLDLPATNLTGTMTMNGGPLPPVHGDYTGGSFYLIAKDTGVSHLIGTFRYAWQSGSTYSLASSTYSARVLPGAYRLVYGRGCSATSSCDSRVDASLGAQVNGYRVLAENVVVSGASQTLDLDLPATNLTGTMTMNGGPLPPVHSDYTGGSFSLVAKDTNVAHLVAAFRYTWQSGSTYVLAGDAYSGRVVPGAYDLLYSRGCDPKTSCDSRVDSALGAQVNGYRVVNRCVATP
jgi:hypothetical protein